LNIISVKPAASKQLAPYRTERPCPAVTKIPRPIVTFSRNGAAEG
jgi:hypothetical protein